MTIEELYDYYQCNWVTVSRELNFGSTTLRLWRKMGYIPARAQRLIENRTDGIFKADKK